MGSVYHWVCSEKLIKDFNMKTFCSLKYAKDKVTTGHNPLKVHTSTVNKHVCPSVPTSVEFNAVDLKHTKFAWMGGKDLSMERRIYTLVKLVGLDSPFNFKLETWDGM